jgi:hypothetical protein
MNEAAEYIDESDDESLLEAIESDDEDIDESAEFLPGIGPILGGVATGVGQLASGIGGVASGIGSSLLGGGARRPRLSGVRLPTATGGVSSATINTPAGAATIALPSAVVRQDEYRATVQRLQDSINRNTSRLNAVGDDVQKLRRDFTTVEADTRAHVAKLRTDTRVALSKARKQTALVLAKVRKDQSQQQMTNLMMTMMMQRQIQDRFESHTHGTPDPADSTRTAPPTTTEGDSSALMLLPMMMMGDSGGSDSNSMMMMAMMMIVMNKD